MKASNSARMILCDDISMGHGLTVVAEFPNTGYDEPFKVVHEKSCAQTTEESEEKTRN